MTIKKTCADDTDALMAVRLEMLRVVNNLDEGAAFDKTRLA